MHITTKPSITRHQIGSTDVSISELSFGGASVASEGDDSEMTQLADRVLSTAWDVGIRHFDTAPKYGHGLSEKRIGTFLSTRERDAYTISTKVGIRLSGSQETDRQLRYDYTYDGVMRSFEQSLDRLQLEGVDILFVHELGAFKNGEEENKRHLKDFMESGMRAIAQLRKSGAVRAVGVGVNEVPICETLIGNTDIDILMPAGRYTLLDQSAAPLFENCVKQNVGILLAGIFNSGILAKGPVPGVKYQYRPATKEMLRKTKEIENVCGEFGVPLRVAALQFAKGHPAITSTVFASGASERLLKLFDEYGQIIPQDMWQRLYDLNLVCHHSMSS